MLQSAQAVQPLARRSGQSLQFEPRSSCRSLQLRSSLNQRGMDDDHGHSIDGLRLDVISSAAPLVAVPIENRGTPERLVWPRIPSMEVRLAVAREKATENRREGCEPRLAMPKYVLRCRVRLDKREQLGANSVPTASYSWGRVARACELRSDPQSPGVRGDRLRSQKFSQKAAESNV